MCLRCSKLKIHTNLCVFSFVSQYDFHEKKFPFYSVRGGVACQTKFLRVLRLRIRRGRGVSKCHETLGRICAHGNRKSWLLWTRIVREFFLQMYNTQDSVLSSNVVLCFPAPAECWQPVQHHWLCFTSLHTHSHIHAHAHRRDTHRNTHSAATRYP